MIDHVCRRLYEMIFPHLNYLPWFQARSKFRWKWKKKRTRRLQKKRRKMRQRSKWGSYGPVLMNPISSLCGQKSPLCRWRSPAWSESEHSWTGALQSTAAKGKTVAASCCLLPNNRLMSGILCWRQIMNVCMNFNFSDPTFKGASFVGPHCVQSFSKFKVRRGLWLLEGSLLVRCHKAPCCDSFVVETTEWSQGLCIQEPFHWLESQLKARWTGRYGAQVQPLQEGRICRAFCQSLVLLVLFQFNRFTKSLDRPW